MSSRTPSIAIIGSGPGGLLLARILQKNHIKCTIYERDSSRSHRQQGGSLDLHKESGLRALREAGLEEEFGRYMRVEGEQMRILDKGGRVWFDDEGEPRGPPGTPAGRPEIDRTDLRNILLDSLEPDTIQWSSPIVSAKPLDEAEGGYTLNFSPDSPNLTVKADVLIGADGAFSRIRPLLTSVTPSYSGISFIDMTLSNAARYPHLSKLVGAGIAFILSGPKGFIPQRNSHDTIRIYVSLAVPEPYLDEHPLPTQPDEAKRHIMGLFEDGWSSEVLDLVAKADDEPITPRKIYALPPDLKWRTELKGITLLGDAAHVMSPFAGEGVNLALLDGLELGKALVGAVTEGGGTEAVDKAIKGYEEAMWIRTKEKADESARNLDIIFQKDSPKGLVELVKSYGPPPE